MTHERSVAALTSGGGSPGPIQGCADHGLDFRDEAEDRLGGTAKFPGKIALKMPAVVQHAFAEQARKFYTGGGVRIGFGRHGASRQTSLAEG